MLAMQYESLPDRMGQRLALKSSSQMKYMWVRQFYPRNWRTLYTVVQPHPSPPHSHPQTPLFLGSCTEWWPVSHGLLRHGDGASFPRRSWRLTTAGFVHEVVAWSSTWSCAFLETLEQTCLPGSAEAAAAAAGATDTPLPLRCAECGPCCLAGQSLFLHKIYYRSSFPFKRFFSFFPSRASVFPFPHVFALGVTPKRGLVVCGARTSLMPNLSWEGQQLLTVNLSGTFRASF